MTIITTIITNITIFITIITIIITIILITTITITAITIMFRFWLMGIPEWNVTLGSEPSSQTVALRWMRMRI